MELSDLKAGQRFRMTGEFTVKSAIGELLRADQDGVEYVFGRSSKTFEVELIEPNYVHGSMYLAADGEHWQFENAGSYLRWYSPGDTTTYDFDVPARPLRRLVPEASDG